MAKRLTPPKVDRSFIGEKIERKLRERIVGQDRAIREICRALHRGAAGLKDPQHPVATLMFAGPTGVGKTFTAQVLAECFKTTIIYRCRAHQYCGYETTTEELAGKPPPKHCPIHLAHEKKVQLEEIKVPNLLLINCGEMGGSMEHAVIKLLGAPPSYVGHGETPPSFVGGKAPRVVLFDEVEKAILATRYGGGQAGLTGLLLRILDEGKVVNNYNEEIDFTSSIIILTSNLGTREIMHQIKGGIGFTAGDRRSLSKYSEEEIEKLNEDIHQLVKNKVKATIPPEFFNRLDRLIVFRFLTRKEYYEILNRELDALDERIVKKPKGPRFYLTHTDEVRDLILDESAEEREYGARPLKRIVEKRITAPLSELINNKLIKEGDHIEARVKNGVVIFYRLDGEGNGSVVKTDPPEASDEEGDEPEQESS